VANFHQNVLNGRQLVQEILNAVVSGKLKEPFYPRDIAVAVPGWDEKTYKLFPWKHCLQNPNIETTPLFFYVGPGVPRPRNPRYEERKYRLLRVSDTNV
jgi:hypothetical protein